MLLYYAMDPLPWSGSVLLCYGPVALARLSATMLWACCLGQAQCYCTTLWACCLGQAQCCCTMPWAYCLGQPQQHLVFLSIVGQRKGRLAHTFNLTEVSKLQNCLQSSVGPQAVGNLSLESRAEQEYKRIWAASMVFLICVLKSVAQVLWDCYKRSFYCSH